MTINEPAFGAYDIDREYIDTLRDNDNPNIPFADYEDRGDARKFYCGPVMTHHGVNYYVPVSHSTHDLSIHGSEQNGFKEFHGMKMISPTGKILGCLDFQYMIPCVNERFIKPYTPGPYGKTQMNFCQQHRIEIKSLARETYNNIISGDYPSLTTSAVDFEKALDTAWEHLDEIEKREAAAQNQATQNQATQNQIKMNNRLILADTLVRNISDESSFKNENDNPKPNDN